MSGFFHCAQNLRNCSQSKENCELSPMKKWFLRVFGILRDTINAFNEDRAFKHGAAIAYYTIFSLPPILIIIIRFTGTLLGEQTVRSEILGQMAEVVGARTADEIKMMIENIRTEKHSLATTILSVGTLLFGATGVFYTLQDSLNTIWGLHHKIKSSFLKVILDRLLSFAMVLSLSFVLMVSMILQSLLVGITTLINRFFETVSLWVDRVAPALGEHLQNLDFLFWVASAINLGVTMLITGVLFAMVFQFLPDAKINKKDLLAGSLFTAVLFVTGEFCIGWYIGHSNVASTYGAAGSVIVILLWVFYSAQILLLGAEFMQIYARAHRREILPAATKFGISLEMLSFRAIYRHVRTALQLKRQKEQLRKIGSRVTGPRTEKKQPGDEQSIQNPPDETDKIL